MGGTRQTRLRRREQEARDRRRQRLITYGAAGVLATAAVILIIGVIITVVLPPRETALVVGERTFNTGEVADRAEAGVRLGGGNQINLNPLVDASIEALINEEVLRQTGEPLTGEVGNGDIREAARERLGVGEEASDEQFSTTYAQFLELTSVSRSDFERIMRASVTRDRLAEQFIEEIPEAGPQVHLLSVTSADRELIEELRERVEAGEDFAETAVELELAESAEAIDQGWQPDEALDDDTREAVGDLDAGALSEIVEPSAGMQLALHFVADRDPERAYDEEAREQLAAERVDAFIEEQREALGVRNEISDGERDWILGRVRDGLSG